MESKLLLKGLDLKNVKVTNAQLLKVSEFLKALTENTEDEHWDLQTVLDSTLEFVSQNNGKAVAGLTDNKVVLTMQYEKTATVRLI